MSQFLLSFTGALFSPPAALSASTPVSCDVTPRDVTLLRRMEPCSETNRWTYFRWRCDVTSRPCGRRVGRSSDRLTGDQRDQPTYSANRKIRRDQQPGGQTSSRAVRPATAPSDQQQTGGQTSSSAVHRAARAASSPAVSVTAPAATPDAPPPASCRWACARSSMELLASQTEVVVSGRNQPW